MDNRERTKDNEKARMELKDYCRRSDLHLQETADGWWIKPKAKFSLKWPQKKDVCKWVHELKVLHGWASNLCKCVDKKYLTLFGIKGHDYDIFLRCIIPVAFNALQKTIGKPLTKFSMFIKELCSTVLPEDKLGIWKKTFN